MFKILLVMIVTFGLIGCGSGGSTTVQPAAVTVEPAEINITVTPAPVVIIIDDNETIPAPYDVKVLFESFKSKVIKDEEGIIVTASVDYSDKIDQFAFFVEIVYIDDDEGKDEDEFEKKIYNPIMKRDGTLGRTLNFIQEVDMKKKDILYVNIIYLGDGENVRLNLHQL